MTSTLCPGDTPEGQEHDNTAFPAEDPPSLRPPRTHITEPASPPVYEAGGVIPLLPIRGTVCPGPRSQWMLEQGPKPKSRPQQSRRLCFCFGNIRYPLWTKAGWLLKRPLLCQTWIPSHSDQSMSFLFLLVCACMCVLVIICFL